MSKDLRIFLILNVFLNSNQISKSNTRSQECYIITKKIIKHWKVPTLSFSLLLHFLHFFLTFSFSSSFSPSLFLLPPSFSTSLTFLAPPSSSKNPPFSSSSLLCFSSFPSLQPPPLFYTLFWLTSSSSFLFFL